jgi:hypothetical protein
MRTQMADGYKPLFVEGDGNCFFRAIYHSALGKGLIKRILDCIGEVKLTSEYNQIIETKIREPAVPDAPPRTREEEEFIAKLRTKIADIIQNREDTTDLAPDKSTIAERYEIYKTAEPDMLIALVSEENNWFQPVNSKSYTRICP